MCCLLWLVMNSVDGLTASFYQQMLGVYSQPDWEGDLPKLLSSQRKDLTYDMHNMLQAWTHMKLKAKVQDKILVIGNVSDLIYTNTIVSSFRDNKDALASYPIFHIHFDSEKGNSSSPSMDCTELKSLTWLPKVTSSNCDASRGIISVTVARPQHLFSEEAFLAWVGQQVHTVVAHASLPLWYSRDRLQVFFSHLLRNRSPIAPAISILVAASDYHASTPFAELKLWLRTVQSRHPMNVDTFDHILAQKLYPTMTNILHQQDAMLSVDILPHSRLVFITPTIRWENLDMVRASLYMPHVTEWVVVYGFNSSSKLPPSMRQTRHDGYFPSRITEMIYDYATEEFSNAGNGERNMALRHLYHRYFSHPSNNQSTNFSTSVHHFPSLERGGEKNNARVQSVCEALAGTDADRRLCPQQLMHDKWLMFLDDDNAVHANFWQLYMHWSLPQLHMVANILHTNLNALVYPEKCKVYWLDSGQVWSSLYLLYRSGEFWQLWHHQADGMFFEAVCKHYPSWLQMLRVAGSYHNALLVPHAALEKDL